MAETTNALPGAESGARREQGRVAVEVERPAFGAGDAIGDGIPSWSVSVDVAVDQLKACAIRPLADEADFDLARVVRIRLELPRRADVPAEHHTRGRFVGQDACPAAFAAVDADVVEVAADARL